MPDDLIDKTRVTPIVLNDAHGRATFYPHHTMTPVEAALIAQLWLKMVLAKGTRLDWRDYLRTNNLFRHFRYED